MMPQPDMTPAGGVCHVVTIPLSKQGVAGEAECRTLGGDAVRTIRQAASLWRDPEYVMRDLRALCAQSARDGLIVWFVPIDRAMRVPAPLEVPIEPLLLRETTPAIIALAAGEDRGGASTTWRAVPWRRWLARLGTTAVLVPMLVQGLLLVSFTSEPWERVLWSAVTFCIVVATVGAWLLSHDWYLVPGGIVARRTLGQAAVQVRRRTRRDAVLVIRPLAVNWGAELLGPHDVLERPLTDIECLALLRAWQSPLEPPSAERMTDLH